MKGLIALDLTWSFLVASTLSSSLVLAVGFGAHHWMKSLLNQDRAKRFLNALIVVVLATLLGGAMILVFFDPTVIEGCFARWSMKSSSYQGTRVLAGLYLGMVSLLTVWDLIQLFQTRRRIQSLPELDCPEMTLRISEIANSILIKAPQRVVVDPHSQGPYVWGVGTPILVLTQDFLNRRDPSVVRCVLAHELMHIKDRDAIWLLGAHLIKRTLFFHPLSYVLSRVHRLGLETAADENAVRSLKIKPKDFSDALIQLGTPLFQRSQAFSMPASSNYRQTKIRIEALFAKPRRSSQWAFRGSVLGLIAIASVVFTYQAEAAFERRGLRSSNEEIMCVQVQHEKIIEEILFTKKETNQCDLK